MNSFLLIFVNLKIKYCFSLFAKMFEHRYCITQLLYLLLKKYIDLSDPARQRSIMLQNFAKLRYLPTFLSYAYVIKKRGNFQSNRLSATRKVVLFEYFKQLKLNFS